MTGPCSVRHHLVSRQPRGKTGPSKACATLETTWLACRNEWYRAQYLTVGLGAGAQR
jgi:hypothetical protein